MNIWNMLLFYIYSGIAFGALIKERSVLLVPFDPSESLEPEKVENLRGRIVEQSIHLGDIMSTYIQNSWMGTYNSNLLNTYEQQKQRAALLEATDTAGQKGA